MLPAGGANRRRILLLGDGLWAAAALRHLVRHFEVPAVVERLRPTDDSLGLAARELGVPLLRLEDVNNAPSREWISAQRVDLLLSVSFDQIFGRDLLASGGTPILNLHAGHPGRHRGRAVLCWQLLEGVRHVDLAVMRVTRGIDQGPLLALSRVELDERGDYGDALHRLCGAVPDLLDAALAALAEDRRAPTAQDGRPVYYPRRREGDEWLDWGRDSTSLLRQVRALTPPNCLARIRHGDRPLRVARAELCGDFPPAAGIPGSVVGKDPARGLLVKTGDGALWLGELRDETGNPVPLRGFRLSDRFGAGGLAELESLRERVQELEKRLSRLEGVGHED